MQQQIDTLQRVYLTLMEIWRKYNGALIPTSPPHNDIDSAGVETIIKKEKAFFARWTTEFDCEQETEFWFIINDKPQDIKDYSKNTRSKIRRGLKRCKVTQISKDTLISQGYNCYRAAFRNYNTSLDLKPETNFKEDIRSKSMDWDFWGIYYQNQLIGYSQNHLAGNSCNYSMIKFHPSFLRHYPSYALFYTMNQYYLNEKSFLYVNDGARSISHDTNIQAYLMQKFKFRKAYCKLHVVYHPRIKLIIRLVMPFGFLFKKLDIGIFKKLNTLIVQENIVRSYGKR